MEIVLADKTKFNFDESNVIGNLYTIFKKHKYIKVMDERPEYKYCLYDIFNKTQYSMSKPKLIEHIFETYKKVFNNLLVSNPVNKEGHEFTNDSIKSMLNKHIDENLEIVKSTTFVPINKIILEEDRVRKLNTYKEPDFYRTILKKKNYKLKDSTIINEIINNLCGNNELKKSYLLQRLAFIIKKPTTRLHGVIVFKGEHGTGKGTFFDTILHTIFQPCYLSKLGDENFKNNFNSELVGKLVLFLDETKFSKDMNNFLKGFTGGRFLEIEPKGKAKYSIENRINCFIGTNENVPLQIDGKDRRVTVFDTKAVTNPRKYFEWSNNKELVLEECKNFFGYLKNLEVDVDFIIKPLDTDERRELIESCKSNEEVFFDYLKERTIYEIIKEFNINLWYRDLTYIGTDDLYSIYLDWCSRNNIQLKLTQLQLSRRAKTYYKTQVEGMNQDNTTKNVRKSSEVFKETSKEEKEENLELTYKDIFEENKILNNRIKELKKELDKLQSKKSHKMDFNNKSLMEVCN